MADRESKPKKKQDEHKALLDQMDEWVHEIDQVLEEEPATLKRP